MQCVILAAGQGARLRGKGPSKPLARIRGTPLVERVIRRACAAGAGEFIVVTGYNGEEVRTELERIGTQANVSITHVVNADWRGGNGVSLLCTRPCVGGEFLLAMCDHLFDPGIMADLIALPAEPGTVTLAVDHGITNPINDLADATRVRCKDGRIERIGKDLPTFNALDTGLFRCGAVMFTALEESQSGGDDSVSGAMSVLARQGRARAFDVHGRLWIDVDDAGSFATAEELLDSGRI